MVDRGSKDNEFPDLKQAAQMQQWVQYQNNFPGNQLPKEAQNNHPDNQSNDNSNLIEEIGRMDQEFDIKSLMEKLHPTTVNNRKKQK